MIELMKDFFIALGGGTVVLIGILTIFKKLFVKYLESVMDGSFKKSFEKFKNELERSTRAFEILLEREMTFYEKTGPIFAELIPLEHDLIYYLRYNEGIEREQMCESFREHFKRYCELIKILRDETLIHQNYIPEVVFSAFTIVTKQMQSDINYWFEMAKFLFAGEYDKIDYNKGEEVVHTLLMHLAAAETKVKMRLKQLCGEV